MRMRKLLCLGLAAAIACTSLPAMGVQAQELQTRQQEEREVTSGTGESEGDFQIEDGVLVKYNGDGGNVVIPEGVTSIGDSAFAGCSGLTEIELPESVSYIDGWAFSDCSGLTKIIIPKSVTYIGGWAFSNCSGLEEISVDVGNPVYDSRGDCNAIIETDDNTLAVGCKNTIVPDDIENIGYSAFGGCSGLTEIELPESVSYIDGWAFSDCSSLRSIKLPENVTGMDYYTFYGCSSLTSITMPKGVTVAGDSVFYGCSSLTSVSFLDDITEIQGQAFYGCSSLASITIPKSVVDIKDSAFEGCSGLEHIVVSEGNPVYDSRNNCNAIIQTESNTLMLGCKNTNIPNNVVSIGDSAFNQCSGLTNLKIPTGVKAIGNYAFYGCVNLTSVTVPQSVTAIGDGAFTWVHDEFKLLVYVGSYAETYAKENDIPYSIVEEGEHVHSYQSQITTQPTCTTAGVKTYSCSCGDSYTETILAVGHKYTKTTQNPTCTAKGAVTYTCSVCNHSYKEEIAAAGHKYTKTTKNPTCTAKGSITYTCTVCNHSYQETIPATGHKYRKTTAKATCTAKGAIICTCTVCKHRYTEKVLPAAGHKYVTTKAAATMKKNGMVTTTCKVCRRKSQTIVYAPKTVALFKTESVYNGKQQKPKVTVKDSKGKNLRKGRDYTVTYQKDMKKAGQHTVTVKFKGNYYGTVKMYLTINPKKTSLSKATPTEKGFDLKWKKQAKEISGYEIAYSTSNKFTPKSTKTLTVGKGKTSKSITGLKAKKKYHVRIRTYKKVKGKKYYSDWSKAKSVKTKK